MRNLYLIGGIAAAAIVIGVGLFFYGPSSLQSDFSNAINPNTSLATSTVPFNVLAEGMLAYTVNDRTNYKITNPDDLQTLWTLIYGEANPPRVPHVDFNKYDVLGVFDGTHSTTGYSIKVQVISDASGMRTIYINHVVPAANCREDVTRSSPFELVEVQKSDLELTHIDEVSTTSCR